MNCYICGNVLVERGRVPVGFNHSNAPVTDTEEVVYYSCTACHFFCCPTMLAWDKDELSRRVYNTNYKSIDLDIGNRSKIIANYLNAMLNKDKIKHLDYGGGHGSLSALLKEFGWDSSSYDPFFGNDLPTEKYNLITAIEVFEHSQNIFETVREIQNMLMSNGVVVFTTQLATADSDTDWWYVCPAGGHIGMLSLESLAVLQNRSGMRIGYLDPSAFSNTAFLMAADIDKGMEAISYQCEKIMAP